MQILKKTNKYLTWVVVSLALVITILPISPEAIFAWEKLTYSKQVGEISKHNELMIPSILVSGEIHEGKNEKVLEQGMWRLPESSTPDKGGNTVIVAHRYQFLSGGDTFYHLDKVNIGDRIYLDWGRERYEYQIYRIDTVSPDQIEIEENTEESILTLYTCTPLWSSEKRLVVRAKLLP